MKRSRQSLDKESADSTDASELPEKYVISTADESAQTIAFAKCVNKESIFLTGSAGTGKSALIHKLAAHWTSTGAQFALTATTGIAAVSIGAKTLHSLLWLRAEDDESTAEEIYARLVALGPRLFPLYQRLIRNLEILVIDEVSMLSPKLFEKISDLLKLLRHNSACFGGLQVVLVGDFFQLGPVRSKEFLFESPEFDALIGDTVLLTKVFRQSDPEFCALLARMRVAELTDEDHEILKSRINADVSNFGIEPTELWCTNKDVDSFNAQKLAQIKSPLKNYGTHFGLRIKKPTKEKDILEKYKKLIGSLDIGLKGPMDIDTEDESDTLEKTKKCTGAQVMLTFNLDTDRGLVNGSRGVITGFASAGGKSKDPAFLDINDENKCYLKGQEYPVVRFIVGGKPINCLIPLVRLSKETKEHVCYCWHMPLKLAWATTIHKSQGLSLDCVKISLDHTVFADGQAYVACSRARTLAGLSLLFYDPKSIRANKKVVEFYKKLQE
jgi:ATP-dependent DNA helicase PIF1